MGYASQHRNLAAILKVTSDGLKLTPLPPPYPWPCNHHCLLLTTSPCIHTQPPPSPGTFRTGDMIDCQPCDAGQYQPAFGQVGACETVPCRGYSCLKHHPLAWTQGLSPHLRLLGMSLLKVLCGQQLYTHACFYCHVCVVCCCRRAVWIARQARTQQALLPQAALSLKLGTSLQPRPRKRSLAPSTPTALQMAAAPAR